MKRFVLRTLLFLSPFLVLLAYFLLFVDQEAMRGDIGRMTQTQFKYNKVTIDTFSEIAPCRKVSFEEIAPLNEDEIVLFGDSFTDVCHWQQFMGWRWNKNVVALADFLRPVDNYLSILAYRPDLLGDTVIIESVERYIINRLCWLDFDNIEKPQPTSKKNTRGPIRGWWRENKKKPLVFYQRRLGIDVPVIKEPIDSPLFSCRPTNLYYFAEDTISHTEWEIKTAAANLQRLDSISRSKGITLYFVAIPDKYTAYRHHIIDGYKHKRLLEEPCPFDTLPCFVNTLPVIDSLIKKGVVNVYLPDDTHFSIPTAKAIGEYVANQITSQP